MEAPVDQVMRRLRKGIEAMALPAIEKISEDEAGDAFQVLIATLLSAQTKDAVTHAAATRLFGVASDPAGLACVPAKRIERLIYPVSFYRHKAKHIRETCKILMSRFGGRVPETMEELLTLPGVGRKTANLVLIVAHRSRNNICVDTHVHRISNRLGWVTTKTPADTEQALYAKLKRRWWPLVNLYLVTWGQHVCKPVYPLCGSCGIASLCPRLGVTRVGRSSLLSRNGT